mgnify:FL=1
MTEKKFKNKYGSWAIVVGSAEGLGEAYTFALAKRKMNLILVDNQQEKLTTISKKIESDFGVETISINLDLKDENAVEKMGLKIKNVDCRLLIYNAAYSLVKPFLNHSEVELDNYIDINTRTQIKLVHQFSKILIEKKQSGGILLMSSLAGLIGMQLVSSYAATKAFAWNLAEALHFELKPQKIDVMACIAGATATPAYLKTNPTYGFMKPLVMKPHEVAESALLKLGEKALFMPGFSNRLNYFILTRLLPRKMAASVANKTMLTMFQQQSKG